MFEYFAHELRLIGSGSSVADRVKLLRMSMRLHLRARRGANRLPRRRDVPINISLRNGLRLRIRTNDYFILFEVLGFGAYDIDLEALGNVEVVVDAGANVGLTTLFLANRLPHAHFYCVEPAPEAFTSLKENLRRNGVAATAIQSAIVGMPGPQRLVPGRHPGEVTTVPAKSADEETVPGWTFANLLDHMSLDSVDLLKLDVEGAEAVVLDQIDLWAPRVRGLIAEIHPPLTTTEAMERLVTAGYRPLALPHNRLFDRMVYVVRPS